MMWWRPNHTGCRFTSYCIREKASLRIVTNSQIVTLGHCHNMEPEQGAVGQPRAQTWGLPEEDAPIAEG